MTVVAAMTTPGGAVLFAADSQTTGGSWCWPTGYRKIQRHTDVPMATGRSGRAGNRQDVLLALCGQTAVVLAARHRLDWPKIPAPSDRCHSGTTYEGTRTRSLTADETESAWADWEQALDGWALEVAEKVSQMALDRGIGDPSDGYNAEKWPKVEGGLLAWDGRLWALGPWEAHRVLRGYEVIGSGAEVASGALWLQVREGRHDTDPETVLRTAIEAAVEFDVGCGGEVMTDLLEPAPGAPRRRPVHRRPAAARAG